MFDVIIVGGSYAGLAAALQLGRARRSVLVVDAGLRRNRFAASSHGFLGQDGQAPQAISAKGRAEVSAYPSVRWLEATAGQVRAVGDGFALRAGGEEHASRRLILATGVVDELPAVEGLTERWGKTVFHCPYCHGYELGEGRRLAVLATGPHAFHQAVLISDWTAPGLTTLLLHDAYEPDDAELRTFAARGIRIERARVARVGGEAPQLDVRFSDGRELTFDGLFISSRTHVPGSFAEQLGCELAQSPVGAFYQTDETKETTVPGVFACGDAALPFGSVTFAVADGARAGFGAHRSLLFPRAEH